jgi:hypothetical protein
VPCRSGAEPRARTTSACVLQGQRQAPFPSHDLSIPQASHSWLCDGGGHVFAPRPLCERSCARSRKP